MAASLAVRVCSRSSRPRMRSSVAADALGRLDQGGVELGPVGADRGDLGVELAAGLGVRRDGVLEAP